MSLVQEIRFRREIVRLAGQRARRRKIPIKRPSARPRLIYQSLLTDRLRSLEELVREIILPELGAWRRQSAAERGVRLDAIDDDLGRTFSQLRAQFAAAHPLSRVERALGQAAESSESFTASAFREQMKAALGVELITPSTGTASAMSHFVDQNLAKISSLEDAALAQVSDIVQRGVMSGVRVESVRDEILHAVKVTRSKASLLARDQTLKLHGQLTQLRQQNAGITAYRWNTSQDDRVRPPHRHLHGTSHRWDDPPVVDPRTGRRAHPGGDNQCRCIAVPDVSELLRQLGV